MSGSMLVDAAEIVRLMDRVADLEGQVRDLGMTPQLGHSAIVDGAIEHVSMVDTGEVDEDGQPIYRQEVTARFGQQEDGTFGSVTVAGPTPPQPTEPTVTGGPGYVSVEWDGLFEDGEQTPLDFLHVAVHIAPAELVDDGTVVMPSPDTVRAVISTPDGAQVVVGDLTPGGYYVSLVTVAQSGLWSPPAVFSTGEPGEATAVDVTARQMAEEAKTAAESAWQEAQEARAAAQAGMEAAAEAQRDATAALTSADGKSQLWYSTAAPTPDNGRDGDTWWQRNDGGVVAVFERAGGVWVERKLTGATIDTISAGQITTGVLQAGVSIITGDPAGARTEIGSSAITAWTVSDAETGPEPTFQIRSNGETPGVVQLVDPATGIASGFDATGGAAFTSTLTESLTVAGREIGSDSRDDLLWELPRGVAGIYKAGEDSAKAGTGELGVCEVSATCRPYRRYRVVWDGQIAATAGSTTGRVFLRWTQDGSEPQVGQSSQLGMRKFVTPPTAGDFVGTHIEEDFFVAGQHGDEKTVRVGLSIQRVAGTGDVWHYSDGGRTRGTLTILDLGPHSGSSAEIYDDGQATTMGGQPATGGGGTVVAPVARKTTTRTYSAAWSRCWRGSSLENAGAELRTGYSSGQLVSAVGAPNQLYADIAGARRIDKIEVYLYATHWYHNSGGTLLLGTHTTANAPSSPPASSGSASAKWTTKTGGKWVTLPTAWHPYFLSGNNRGVTLGYGAGSSRTHYARLAGANAAYPPKFRITYTK